MKLNQLKALLAIADAGSIHEAARMLHLTPSALSKAVKELEREFGTELLTRSAKGMRLTECGLMLSPAPVGRCQVLRVPRASDRRLENRRRERK